MPRVVLEPSPLELGLFRDQYEALVGDLEAEGYEVVLVRPVEERGGFPDAVQAVDLVVNLLAGAVALKTLMPVVRKHLRGRRGSRTRRGEIHLPGGEIHRFDLPDE